MARTMDQIEDALETLGAKLYAHGDLIERLEGRVQDLEAEVYDLKR